MKKDQEIEQYVSFSRDDFSLDVRNNIVHAIDSTGKTVAIDTWKYAIYFFQNLFIQSFYRDYASLFRCNDDVLKISSVR